jgi:hypothetical protein
MPQYIIDASKVKDPWKRVELYQNTTLRYPPVPEFAAMVAAAYGRPHLLRCWVTLDEVWDYRTDEYFLDYQIGVNRYKDDPNHFIYDWGSTVPTQIHIQEHLKSFSENSDALMLNLRRYERETAEGIVSLDKYEEVVEKVVAFYKQLCPNIRYIEVSNESDYRSFGDIDGTHYYKLYQRVCNAVTRLNNKNQYAMPLGVGGTSTNAVMSRPQLWREFLQNLASDKNPNFMLDFYSVHDYTRDPDRLKAFYAMHQTWIKELELPDLPIHVDEDGYTDTTGVWTDSLKNASGVLVAMIQSADLPGLHIHPWCTYHNPNLQMSFTQYITLEDGAIVPTPNGHAMRALALQKKDRLEIGGKQPYNSAILATADESGIAILATNATGHPQSLEISLQLPEGGKTVTRYLVDRVHNNLLTGPETRSLLVTERFPAKQDTLQLSAVLDDYAFSLWIIEPA